jgi:hypothetical protein
LNTGRRERHQISAHTLQAPFLSEPVLCLAVPDQKEPSHVTGVYVTFRLPSGGSLLPPQAAAMHTGVKEYYQSLPIAFVDQIFRLLRLV